jgi:hypothetical protein
MGNGMVRIKLSSASAAAYAIGSAFGPSSSAIVKITAPFSSIRSMELFVQSPCPVGLTSMRLSSVFRPPSLARSVGLYLWSCRYARLPPG